MRKNAPTRAQRKKKENKNKKPEELVEGELDWGFKISNEDLYRITKSTPVSKFCEVQYLKYIAHICRMSNDSLQKQALFDKRTPSQKWSKIEKMLGLERSQIRRIMMKKSDFMALLDKVYDLESKQSRSKSKRSTREKI